MKKPSLIFAFLTIAVLQQFCFSQTSEIQAFLGGQKTKYSTEGHPKAKGINISIEYPSNWQRSEGERPNIVQTFTSDESTSYTQCLILIKDLPSFMKLFSTGELYDEMFTQETLKEMIPESATFIKGEQTKYDGQPGAWMIYVTQSERAGLTAEIYTLQHMFLFSGKLIVLQCGVAGLAGSGATVENDFTRYLPLFQLLGNSIVIHDKWEKPINEGGDSIMEIAFGEYWWLNLIVSVILTWGIGLAPPLLIRFAFLRRPISKGWAIGIVVFFWIINIMFFTAIGSKSKTHATLFLVAWASYAILRKGVRKQQSMQLKSTSDQKSQSEVIQENMGSFQNVGPEELHKNKPSSLQPFLTEPLRNNAAVSKEPEPSLIPRPTHDTTDTTNHNAEEYKQGKNYGGIRRLGYFLGMIGVAVINAVFTSAAQGESGIAFLGMIITVTASFILVVNRLHNIGKSGWLSLLIIIPIANLFVGIPCLVLPEGYQDTKKLDITGKVIVGILIGLGVLTIVGLIVSFMA